mgnify:CR=1 FL=1
MSRTADSLVREYNIFEMGFRLELRENGILPELRANYFNTFGLGTIIDIYHIWYILTLALIKNEKKNNPISSNQFNYRYGFIVRIEAKIRL